MDGVMPKNYASDFAKSWIPSILEASIDVQKSLHLYKFNEDPHIEDILETVSKLQMERLCRILQQFVFAYNISIGVDPLDSDVPEAGEERVDHSEPPESELPVDEEESKSITGMTQLVSLSNGNDLLIFLEEGLVGLA